MMPKYIKTGITILVAFTTTWVVHADIFGAGTNVFTMDFAAIGEAGNPAQSSANHDHSQGGGDGLGAVDYGYRMGKYQVAIDQFVKANAESAVCVSDNAGKAILQEYENLDKRNFP